MSASRSTRRLCHAAAAVVSALALTATGPTAAQARPSGPVAKRLCSQGGRPGVMACTALARTDVTVKAMLGPGVSPGGFGPADLRAAYGLPADGGSGQTVAIVDAYDDPNAEKDLTAYRKQFGLPECTTASGCLRKTDQTGGTTYPEGNSGWAGEISLDLDMVSAVAPSAHILLVEAKSADLDDLGAAENEAVALGAKYVSNSYGGGETSSETAADAKYFRHPGVAITAASGDSGYGTQYPAASPDVVAVGGTSLKRGPDTRGWTEAAWGGTKAGQGAGAGCSAYEPKPSWQHDSGCARRTIADVSAVADPATGVAVYDTYQAGGWNVYGGTSVSAPLIAAVYALAGPPSANSSPASFPYAHASALNDITTGSDGTCTPAYLCTAGPGYDGPTGLGTPNGTTAFTG
ncbi:S53 family peptidase [Streptomyces sp. PTM05]|uniref:S53 family peptidase n=1 Tax=Streptantibioticus parmotrematis TaxID=2873249 RepID=A0ABS7QRS8_9ACTN|nr:S53 family peptidase [Streptantibioticus parmotrematis]MBY8885090.1 S53 family peptidase [Streptantibioticus parmotrematis]